ncbi:MAG: hypothetical protein H0V97_01415 [Actinobacteria bacterium]|nr:hypothetical protein [Actinomycetota bacterium]
MPGSRKAAHVDADLCDDDLAAWERASSRPTHFSYGTALALHGAATTERSEVLITSPRRFDTFEHEGIRYCRTPAMDRGGQEEGSRGAGVRLGYDPEKTLVECARIPSNARGLAELLRAAAALPRPSDAMMRFPDRRYYDRIASFRVFALNLCRPDLLPCYMKSIKS